MAESRAEYQREYRKKRLIKEPDWNTKLHAAKTKTAREAINKLKASGCTICGYKKSFSALHFHHHENGSKESYNSIVGRYVSSGRVVAAIKEAKKCMLVCSNCHSELHDKERNMRG